VGGRRVEEEPKAGKGTRRGMNERIRIKADGVEVVVENDDLPDLI
jgi:hypothetical protein